MLSRTVPLCVVFLLFAAFTPAQDAKKELAALQGEWTNVSVEVRGKKGTTKLTVTIEGDQWIINGQKEYPKIIKIDPSKNPKTIDLKSTKQVGRDGVEIDPARINPDLGIYKLEDDTLTICLTQGPGQRPTEFNSTGGKFGSRIDVYKRVKK